MSPVDYASFVQGLLSQDQTTIGPVENAALGRLLMAALMTEAIVAVRMARSQGASFKLGLLPVARDGFSLEFDGRWVDFELTPLNGTSVTVRCVKCAAMNEHKLDAATVQPATSEGFKNAASEEIKAAFALLVPG